MQRLLLVLCLFAALAGGCERKPHARANVAVSVFPLYDLVRRIAGPDADVTLVLPPGASPQGWRVTPDVSSCVAATKLFISVGLGLDPWMEYLRAQAPPGSRALKLGDRVPTVATDDGAIHPYVWMDPQRARLMATTIPEVSRARTRLMPLRFRSGQVSSMRRSRPSTRRSRYRRVLADARRRKGPGQHGLLRRALWARAWDGRGLERDRARGPRRSAWWTGVKVGTYEDVIRLATAALEPIAPLASPTGPR